MRTSSSPRGTGIVRKAKPVAAIVSSRSASPTVSVN
jgi:hypothetical protein